VPASPEAARAALDTLRNDRLAGRVDQSHYLERSEYLQRVAAGEKIAAVDPHAVTMDQQFQRQYEEHMRPPAMEQYRLPPMPIEFDIATRKALAAASIPDHLAAPIAEGVVRASQATKGASAGEVQVIAQSVAGKLRDAWGDQFDTRLAAVEDLLDDMAEADPLIGAIVDRMPHAFAADLAVMTHLDTVAQYRSRR